MRSNIILALSIPMPFLATSQEIEISTRGTGFENILTQIDRPSSNNLTEFFQHGCWCSSLGALSLGLPVSGSNNPLDPIDQDCHDWFKRWKCLNLPQTRCAQATSYTVIISEAGVPNCATNANNLNPCKMDHCLVDTFLATRILTQLSKIKAAQLQFPLTTDHSDCIPSYQPSDTCEKICTGTAPDVTAVCAPPPEVDACENTKFDLLFIIDGSGSVGIPNFPKITAMIENMSRTINVQPGGSRIAMVQYSSHMRLEFDFLDSTSQISAVLSNVVYQRRGTKTGRALQFAMDGILSARGGSNELVVVVVTDGESFDSQADDVDITGPAIDSFGTVFAVSVGNAVPEDQLMSIASSPEDQHILHIGSFDELADSVYSMAQSFCGAVS